MGNIELDVRETEMRSKYKNNFDLVSIEMLKALRLEFSGSSMKVSIERASELTKLLIEENRRNMK